MPTNVAVGDSAGWLASVATATDPSGPTVTRTAHPVSGPAA